MSAIPPSRQPSNGEDRARAMLDGMARFVRAFRSPHAWPDLPDQDFRHMAFLACLTFERHPERALRMFRLFADLAHRFGVPDRLRLLGTLVAFIEEGRATAEALMPFILFDQSDAVISAAACEFALLYASPSNHPMAGAALLLARQEQGQVLMTRRAPVIAGLLHLGDMRLAPHLLGKREFAGPAARRAMAGAEGAFVTTLHVEFLLDWLEHAATPEDAVAAADALAAMPNWSVDGMVTEVARTFPSTAAPVGAELDVRTQTPFVEYLALVRPRLSAAAMFAEIEGEGAMQVFGPSGTTAEAGTRVREAIERVMQAWSRATPQGARVAA